MLYAGLAILATLGAPVDQRLARLQAATQAIQGQGALPHAHTHAERVGNLHQQVQEATSRKMTVDITHQALLAASVSAANTPPQPSTHGELSGDYKALYEDSEMRRKAQEALCAACSVAEGALIGELDTAKDKHATAQTKSDEELAALQVYETAKSAWQAKRTEYANKKADLACPALTVDSDPSVFTAAETLINELQTMAEDETGLESTMNDKNGLYTATQSAYATAKAEATAADGKVAAAESAKNIACAGLGVPPSAPPSVPPSAPPPVLVLQCDPAGPYKNCGQRTFNSQRTCTSVEAALYQGQRWCTQVHCCES